MKRNSLGSQKVILKNESALRDLLGIDLLHKKALVSISGSYEWCEYKKILHVIITDTNGTSIVENASRFEFDFLENNNETVKLVGRFLWNSDELRYEVEVFDNSSYSMLSYNEEKMSNITLKGLMLVRGKF